MSIQQILNNLNKVKRTGDGRYVACCPAHDDSSPSLTVRELPDGRVLMHCFGGCDIESILSAMNLQLADLFPEAIMQHGRPNQRPFNPSDVLLCVRNESRLSALAIADILHGRVLSNEQKERLLLAAERLNEAYEVSHG